MESKEMASLDSPKISIPGLQNTSFLQMQKQKQLLSIQTD